MTIIPIILSGGSGTRLWPLSRKHYPKQLLNLTAGAYTMLQETLVRVTDFENPIIVCNEDHRFMVAEQCHSIGVKPQAIILEPVGRNTAPAIALAALEALKIDPEAVIAVFPADHIIENQESFIQSLSIAIETAQQDKLVTFGIVAKQAETGYGYIKSIKSNAPFHKVEKFVEKPNIETAKSYIESGDYYWNSGMFVFKASIYLSTLEKNNIDIITCCSTSLEKAVNDLDFTRVDKETFKQCPDNSIDYAIMESSDNVVVVPMNAGWNDLGSWSSLWDISTKDKRGNAHYGDVIAINSNNNLVYGNDKLIATIGINSAIIIDTKDALLIAHKDSVQDVKEVVSQLKIQSRKEHLNHREVQRPWGCYDLIDHGTRYQVKRITVKPGASLSLQMHHHRAEHWIVVTGTAVVQVGENEELLTENQSIYISIGETHRLTNPGKVPLELIEVQTGSYLGEDDIVRFEDKFGRCNKR